MAFVQVDDRLGGEGTGRILGSQGNEIWAIFGVFTLIWTVFYVGQRSLGGGKGDDSGLSL
jgi:Photosystem II reaction centre W protein (PsbW)